LNYHQIFTYYFVALVRKRKTKIFLNKKRELADDKICEVFLLLDLGAKISNKTFSFCHSRVGNLW